MTPPPPPLPCDLSSFLRFWEYTQWSSWLTPASVLKDYTWWDLGNHMGFQEAEIGWLCKEPVQRLFSKKLRNSTRLVWGTDLASGGKIDQSWVSQVQNQNLVPSVISGPQAVMWIYVVVQEGLMEEPLVTPAFQRSSQWPGLGICMNIDWVLLRFLGGNRGEVMQSSPRELVFDGWTVEVLNTFKTRKKKEIKGNSLQYCSQGKYLLLWKKIWYLSFFAPIRISCQNWM